MASIAAAQQRTERPPTSLSFRRAARSCIAIDREGCGWSSSSLSRKMNLPLFRASAVNALATPSSRSNGSSGLDHELDQQAGGTGQRRRLLKRATIRAAGHARISAAPPVAAPPPFLARSSSSRHQPRSNCRSRRTSTPAVSGSRGQKAPVDFDEYNEACCGVAFSARVLVHVRIAWSSCGAVRRQVE